MFTSFAVAAGSLTRGASLSILLGCVPAPLSHQQVPPGRAEQAIGRLAIRDGELAAAVIRAVRGASRRLGQPSCAAILDEFKTDAGRPLSDVLSSLELSAPGSMSRIIFRDGREAAMCRAGVAAFTGPGSRVVFVCGDRFARIGRSRAEQVVIHEMLHTLGLGERPPLPGEIDRVIARRCGP